MRRVILFDIDGLLDTLSPHLNSEITDKFIIFSPSDVETLGWFRCCNFLHHSIQNKIQMEFWFLFNLNNNNEQVQTIVLSDYSFANILDKAPDFIKENVQNGKVACKKIIWVPSFLLNRVDGYLDILDQEETSNNYSSVEKPPVIINTVIDNQSANVDLNLEQKFLLPMSVVCLKYQSLLIPQRLSHKTYIRLKVEADEQHLIQSIEGMNGYYKKLKDSFLEIRNDYIYDFSTYKFYSLSFEKNINTSLPEFNIENLQIGFFYNPFEDEQNVEEWFTESVSKTIQIYQNFKHALNNEFEECLSQLNNLTRTEDYKSMFDSVDKVCPDSIYVTNNANTDFEKLKDSINSFLSKSTPKVDKSNLEELKRVLDKWRQNTMESLITILIQRPTIKVATLTAFFTFLLSFLCLLYATNNNPAINTIQTIRFSPIQFKYLLSISFAVILSIILLGGILLIYLKNKCTKKYHNSLNKLKTIHEMIIKNAEQDISEKKRGLTTHMLGKNMTLIQNIEESLKLKTQKYNHTEEKVSKHIEYVTIANNAIDNTRLANHINLKLEPCDNISLINELSWQRLPENSLPMVYEANSQQDYENSNEDTNQVLNKLSGLEKVTFS